MRRFVLAAMVVLAAAAYPVATFAGPGGSDKGIACSLSTQLRGADEVPPRDTEAFGHVLIKVRNDGSIEWNTHIVNPGGETFFAGHIHEAPAGVAGPVVVPLFAGSNSDRQIRDSGETAAGNPEAEDICADPADYYVNYHTTIFPGGAVRGQLG